MQLKSPPTDRCNVADRLAGVARRQPQATAVAVACHRGYRTTTFAELDADAELLARGLVAWGVTPGSRLALLVRPGIEFVTLVFAVLRSGATLVLIDPGMGRRHLIDCLATVQPDGFLAIPRVQWVRALLRRRFRTARWNVTVGPPWYPFGQTLQTLRRLGNNPHIRLPQTRQDDPAAIVFTTGSTGPPKGVLYRQQTFETQVDAIQSSYNLRPGGIDLACFPLFGLFNSAIGVTTVFPAMDSSRPAAADPRRLLTAARDWQVTQAFASPAVWNKLSRYCVDHQERIPTLRQVFSCGAPVPADVIQRTLTCVHPEGELHTPYGATEALPVATLEAREILQETATATAAGAGVCVGRQFPTIRWKVVKIVDGPLPEGATAEELPTGEIGELWVCGPQVSRRYVTRVEANQLSKVVEDGQVWHRMGDVGYLDAQQRFWYCGRLAHRVQTIGGTLFTIPCEAVVNQLAAVARSALVGVGPAPQQQPVLVVEPLPAEWPRTPAARASFVAACQRELQSHSLTQSIETVLLHRSLPVDIRHNAKIFRERLAPWAARRL